MPGEQVKDMTFSDFHCDASFQLLLQPNVWGLIEILGSSFMLTKLKTSNLSWLIRTGFRTRPLFSPLQVVPYKGRCWSVDVCCLCPSLRTWCCWFSSWSIAASDTLKLSFLWSWTHCWTWDTNTLLQFRHLKTCLHSNSRAHINLCVSKTQRNGSEAGWVQSFHQSRHLQHFKHKNCQFAAFAALQAFCVLDVGLLKLTAFMSHVCLLMKNQCC